MKYAYLLLIMRCALPISYSVTIECMEKQMEAPVLTAAKEAVIVDAVYQGLIPAPKDVASWPKIIEKAIDSQKYAYLLLSSGSFDPVKHHSVHFNLKSLAEDGDINACCNLGFYHQYCDGTQGYLAKASIRYKEAAEKGHVLAQYFYAALEEIMSTHNQMLEGFHLEQASEWYEKSAQQGHIRAQRKLSTFLLRKPTPLTIMTTKPSYPNPERARYWGQIALKQYTDFKKTYPDLAQQVQQTVGALELQQSVAGFTANTNNNLGKNLSAIVSKLKAVSKKEYSLDDLLLTKELHEANPEELTIETLQIMSKSIQRLVHSLPPLNAGEQLMGISIWIEKKCKDLLEPKKSTSTPAKKDKQQKKAAQKEKEALTELQKTAQLEQLEIKQRIDAEKKRLVDEERRKKKTEKADQKKQARQASAAISAPAGVGPTTEKGSTQAAEELVQNSSRESQAPSLEVPPMAVPAEPISKEKVSQAQLESDDHKNLSSEKSASAKNEMPVAKKPKIKRRPSELSLNEKKDAAKNSDTSSTASAAARPPLLRTLSLASIESPDAKKYKRLKRQLSVSNLQRVRDLKLDETDILQTLKQLEKDSLIDFRHENNTIVATKRDDHALSITIHTHNAKGIEWAKNPKILSEFLEFVHAVNPTLQ
jgi:TPR repeat protein